MSDQRHTYVKGGDPHGPVVVGVDGSGSDSAAVAWAAHTAARHQVPLRLLHSSEIAAVGAVQDDPTVTSDATMAAQLADGDASRPADQLIEQMSKDYPDLVVQATETAGAASEALLQWQDTALLLVVGSGRRGGIGDWLLGTTSLNTAMHASCPVAVVNNEVDVNAASLRVVVGVDGSRDSAAAAEIAFAAADARGAKVECVSSWYLEVVKGLVVTDEDSPQWREIEDRQRERVESAIKAGREAHPDVEYVVDIVHGLSNKVLSERSVGADVLVLGSRGRGGFAGKLLGSVSQKVLQAAQSPVIIVKSSEKK